MPPVLTGGSEDRCSVRKSIMPGGTAESIRTQRQGAGKAPAAIETAIAHDPFRENLTLHFLWLRIWAVHISRLTSNSSSSILQPSRS